MPHAYGIRSRTRKLFAKGFRKHGTAPLRKVTSTYRKGEYVDVVVDGAVHKGMPYKIYQGKTGKIFNVNPNSIGVIVNKRVRGRIEPKRLHIRVEHVRKSNCKAKFQARVRLAESEKRAKAPKKDRKRMPGKPVGEKFVVPAKDTDVNFQNPFFHKEIF